MYFKTKRKTFNSIMALHPAGFHSHFPSLPARNMGHKARSASMEKVNDIKVNKHSWQSDFRGGLLSKKVITYKGNFHLTNFTVFK